MTAPAPTYIGANRQLFVADFWLAAAQGVTRRLYAPVRREVAIAVEHPWERSAVSYMVTFRDGERFRSWYRCDADVPTRGRRQPLIAYAESLDGVHWEKPRLGLLGFRGAEDNNLVWMEPGNALAPFRDSNPQHLRTSATRLSCTPGIYWHLPRPMVSAGG